jgi:hypothetical protein
MIEALSKLSTWLESNRLLVAAERIKALVKVSAGKPMPLDREKLDDIAEEILDEFGAKMLGNNIYPTDVIKILSGHFRANPSALDLLNTEIKRTSTNIEGKTSDLVYGLYLVDQFSQTAGGFMPGYTPKDGSPTVPGRMAVIIGPGTLPPEKFESFIRALERNPYFESDFDKSFKLLREMLKEKILSTIIHEETHAKDIMTPLTTQRTYIIEAPDEDDDTVQPPETLETIAKKFHLPPSSLFISNIQTLMTDRQVFSIRETLDFFSTVTNALTNEQASQGAQDFYKNVAKDKPLPPGTKILFPASRGASTLSKDGDTLRDIIKQRGLNEDRILLVNFKDLILPSFFGNPPGWQQQSYQEIYDYLKKDTESREMILSMPLPPGIEVVSIPDLGSLYYHSRDFYLLTREESKAHLSQIAFEVEQAIKDLDPEDVRRLSLEEMKQLSPTAQQYEVHLGKKNEVDEIIKTPFYGKTIAELKRERYRDYQLRMVHIWETQIKNQQPQ